MDSSMAREIEAWEGEGGAMPSPRRQDSSDAEAVVAIIHAWQETSDHLRRDLARCAANQAI
jgi:hypothetical protein